MIGSAVVGRLADGLMGCLQLKWVAPVEVPFEKDDAPLDPPASLVFLLETLELADSVLAVFNAVGH